MCNWVIIDGKLFLEHLTQEGETVLVPEDEVQDEDVFIVGFYAYFGAELLSNKP